MKEEMREITRTRNSVYNKMHHISVMGRFNEYFTYKTIIKRRVFRNIKIADSEAKIFCNFLLSVLRGGSSQSLA